MSITSDSAILQHNDTILEEDYPEILGQVVIEADTTTRFVVGIFEKQIPEPQLRVDFDGDVDVDTSLERQSDGDEYRLTYHFRSLQGSPCLATVKAY